MFFKNKLLATFDGEVKKEIYIDYCGDYILRMGVKEYSLKNEDNYLYCLTILETPYEEVLLKLSQYDGGVTCAIKLFPFIKIIKYAFREDLFNQHWVALALNWLSKIGINNKLIVKCDLEKIVLNKAFSQQLRHKAMKELAKIKNYDR